MEKLTELDEMIVDVARQMILSRGILDTDMKDIAKEIGCSRSTLYRHFAGKGDILLVLADRALNIIREAQVIPREYRFSKGLEAFAWQLNSMLDAMLRHVNEITYLRDFDCLYAKNYPQSKGAESFEGKVHKSTVKSPLQESYNRGVEDGSIKSADDPELFILMVFQTMMSLAQRMLPVEEVYITAYGYGQEVLRAYVNFIIESVQNT